MSPALYRLSYLALARNCGFGCILYQKCRRAVKGVARSARKCYNTTMKFEDKLAKLEKLVEAMESGSLSLDDSIKSFEEGRRLVDECSRDLDAIRLKIEKVTASGAVETVQAAEPGDAAP